MAEIEVPGPEPEWETAPSYQGGKRNPAFQQSMWESAAGSFQLVAGLKPPLEALAARLRLTLERGWEDLGYVDVAMFRIERVNSALSRLEKPLPYRSWSLSIERESRSGDRGPCPAGEQGLAVYGEDRGERTAARCYGQAP
ncbi:hypothetical protein [Kitasatospora sp. NPDC085879]|uniref:hypothetical protein n=1 Tax=Kitasatospora sp. NPDC085879 TaxID=3154769 RepID=UPI00344108F2